MGGPSSSESQRRQQEGHATLHIALENAGRPMRSPSLPSEPAELSGIAGDCLETPLSVGGRSGSAWAA